MVESGIAPFADPSGSNWGGLDTTQQGNHKSNAVLSKCLDTCPIIWRFKANKFQKDAFFKTALISHLGLHNIKWNYSTGFGGVMPVYSWWRPGFMLNSCVRQKIMTQKITHH